MIRNIVTIVVPPQIGYFPFFENRGFQMLALSVGNDRVFEGKSGFNERDKTIEHWVLWLPVLWYRKIVI